MNIDFIKESPRKCTTSKYWRINYPDMYPKIETCNGVKFPEKLYNFMNKSPDHICPVCGKITQFISYIKGYRKYCSSKCATTDDARNQKISIKNKANAKIIAQKRAETNLRKYGTIYPQKLDSVKEKTKATCLKRYNAIAPMANKDVSEKSKKTILNKYGVEYISQTEIFKTKFKNTCLQKYGVENPNQSDAVRQKAKATCIKKYGVEYISQVDAVRQKAKATCIKKYGAPTWAQAQMMSDDILEILDDGRLVMKCPHPTCNKCSEKRYITTSQINHDRKKINTERCTIIHPIQQSHSKNTGGEIFIQQILDSCDVEYVCNYRDLGFELDIYIPEKKIAIEFNGYRWHSDKYKPKKYHVDKYKKCEANGIQLISIWEDWMMYKPTIVESIIKSKLGIYNQRIGARKCILREVNAKDAEKFLEEMHIQGTCHSTIKLGLFYNDELVSLMTFGKKRPGLGCKGNEWELLRFCNAHDVQIIGGASKLLNEFIKRIKPSKIISFSSNDISSGQLYSTLGFNNTSESLSYWYIDKKNAKRYHRFTFTKQNILRKGLATDANLTEAEMMYNAGFYRIWDSGTKKWEL